MDQYMVYDGKGFAYWSTDPVNPTRLNEPVMNKIYNNSVMFVL